MVKVRRLVTPPSTFWSKAQRPQPKPRALLCLFLCTSPPQVTANDLSHFAASAGVRTGAKFASFTSRASP
jgi:hypothetical protein